jgi:hypothetical protein
VFWGNIKWYSWEQCKVYASAAFRPAWAVDFRHEAKLLLLLLLLAKPIIS